MSRSTNLKQKRNIKKRTLHHYCFSHSYWFCRRYGYSRCCCFCRCCFAAVGGFVVDAPVVVFVVILWLLLISSSLLLMICFSFILWVLNYNFYYLCRFFILQRLVIVFKWTSRWHVLNTLRLNKCIYSCYNLLCANFFLPWICLVFNHNDGYGGFKKQHAILVLLHQSYRSYCDQ